MLLSFIPYAKDIIAGKVKPSRSARLMMLLILLIGLLQQQSLGSGWLLAMTLGDGIGAIAILLLALKKGVGGLSRLDTACYALLAFDVAIWLSTGNALLALHLSILADVVAMTPVLHKTWCQPWTETPLFFLLGVVGPLLNILAVGRFSYSLLLFPVYIAAINLVETILILYRQQVIQASPKSANLEHQTLI